MAIIKCKMCGGDLNLVEGASTAECEYCGSVQTVPKVDDEKKLTLFARANRLRAACEFDKAAGIYEAIVADFPEEAEAYWGLVLCKYGIEYVDDPATGKKIPTCHRSSFDSVMEDSNFEQAVENADTAAQKVYREEAKQFERLRKGILEVSSTEKPYDIFICYKETDEKGDRTLDSVLAQDLYSALTDKGYRVFFSRITLQGKLGEAYEPYIFAALNSAKVMLAVGTCYEYYNAVWVKNEWSRYLKICEADKNKHLIPCYKDLDPEDMPKEFNHLQGADLGKMGAVQDILFNMEKYIPLKKETTTVIQKETVITSSNNPTIESYLKRAFMFLEDGDWNGADEYCEKVLDIDPECAEAYLGKLMAELRVQKQEKLKDQVEPFDDSNNYQKAVRFAGGKLKAALTSYIEHINTRNENARVEGIYTQAKELQKVAQINSIGRESNYRKAAELFATICDYKDANELKELCSAEAEILRKDAVLAEGKAYMSKRNAAVADFEAAIKKFRSISGWKDANEKIPECEKKIEEIKAKEEAVRLERERKAEIARKEAARIAKRNRRIAIVTTSIIFAVIAISVLLNTVIIPNVKYNGAIALMDAEKYGEAISAFENLDGYKDSENKIAECNVAILDCKYNNAIALIDAGNLVEAYEAFIALDGYKDSADKANSIYHKYKVEKLKSAKVGDYVFFGTYEQDNNLLNGKEDVEWLVLEEKDGKALVISKNAIACKQYNTRYTGATWETCTLRKWLNNDFINSAFSADEKAMIPEVTVSADKNPKYGTDPGKATQDQAFLLSIIEVNKYFSPDDARRCEPTDYAVAHGAYVNSSNGNCRWWLRSPGNYQGSAAGVDYDGDVDEGGTDVGYVNRAVRPAMWIDLNA